MADVNKLAALRTLAEKATPGAWREHGVYESQRGSPDYAQIMAPGLNVPIAYVHHSEHDSKFIAAANPRTVLALLDVMDSLARYFESHKHGLDSDIEQSFCDLSDAYDRAIASQQQEGTTP